MCVCVQLVCAVCECVCVQFVGERVCTCVHIIVCVRVCMDAYVRA